MPSKFYYIFLTGAAWIFENYMGLCGFRRLNFVLLESDYLTNLNRHCVVFFCWVVRVVRSLIATQFRKVRFLHPALILLILLLFINTFISAAPIAKFERLFYA